MTALRRRELLADDPAVLHLVQAAGVHGVYVHNALDAGEGDGFVLAGDGGDVGLAWFGPRGNLVVLAPDAPLQAPVAQAFAEAILTYGRPWRLAMGPTPVVDVLRERAPVVPLVCRDQIYYRGDARSADGDLVRGDVRPAQRADRDRLLQATLLLNASDLNIDPARVDERIADGSTRVIGPPGGIACKLEIGSDGPAGGVLEGVFTFPEQRGQHFASRLVASCLAEANAPMSLHVGQHNRPARAAYERAGMHEAGRCRLLLLG